MKEFKKGIRSLCKFCAYILGFQETDKTRYNKRVNKITVKVNIKNTEKLKKKIADYIEIEKRSDSKQLMVTDYEARYILISLGDAV